MINPKEIAKSELGKIIFYLWQNKNHQRNETAPAMHNISWSEDFAEAIIDALGVVFIDDDTGVEKGDLVVSQTHPFRFDGIDNNDKTNGLFYSHLGKMYFKYMYVKIIQKKGKPVINVSEL